MTRDEAIQLTFLAILALLALYGIGCVIVGGYRYYRDHKPNRRVRNGWRKSVTQVHDASCKSGWSAHVQRGRYVDGR